MPSNSNLRFPFRKAREDRAGVALVIVLAFVLLLTVVVLTLLSRSLSNGLISGASVNFSKTDLYGHGAVNQIMGDLRQEIMAGSQISGVSPQTVPVTGAPSVIIYRPSVFLAAAPYRAGPYGPTSPTWSVFPNLIKESTRNVAFYPSSYDAHAPTRAAAINSFNDSSINGRYVSMARWNKHLLLPKASATITVGTGATPTTISDNGTDTTPVGSFVAPDWILTTADGSNPTTLDTTSSPTTSSVNPQSPKYVIGRYAYAIYNEGGLLDANVAGSPVPTGSSNFQATNASGPSPWTQATVLGKKGTSAFADLTQLPGIANVSVGAQKVVDQLVGWRNYASAQPTGTFPAYSLTSSINNYFTYLLQLNTRFMSTGNPSLFGGAGDHLFSSRQQLISFFQNIANGNTSDQAYLQDAMMYLGTFSRTLNQPSYWPDPNRPKVVSSGFVSLGPGGYGGGNDSDGDDIGTAPPYKGIYNPPFRAITVTNANFTRNDGTTPVVGEPLVKKRFALNRLCWITYKGPSATLSTSDPVYTQFINDGISPQLLSEGTAANILKYFGLTWTAGPGTVGIGGYWVYNHGLTGGIGGTGAAGNGTSVGTLRAVANVPREPDFFEILQAAVNVGSMAKGWSNSSGGDNGEGPSGLFDTPVINSQMVYHVLQLGANIIDEVNPTQYPTHIEFKPGPGVYSIYGATDLPYFNGLNDVAFIAQPAIPASTTGAPVQTTAGATLTAAQSGVGAMMAVPIIWNPYDQNGPAAVAGPGTLRIVVGNLPSPTLSTAGFSFDPLSTGTWAVQQTTGSLWKFTVDSQTPTGSTNTGDTVGIVNGSTTFPPSATWTSENSTALTFANPTPGSGSTLYRLPTALTQANVPSGSSLALGSGNYIPQANSGWSQGIPDNGSGPNLLGFLVGTFPIRWNQSVPMTTPAGTSNTYTLTAAYVVPFNNQLPQGLTIRLEYQSGTSWIPYRDYFVAPENDHIPFPLAESGTSSSPSMLLPLLPAGAMTNRSYPGTGSGSLWDGNYSDCNQNVTARVSGSSGGAAGMYAVWDPRTPRWGGMDEMQPLSISNSFVPTFRPGAAIDSFPFPQADPNAPQDGWHSDTNGTTQWEPGSYCQNIVQGGASYYEDADGVVRRGMAGLATTTTGLPLATGNNPPAIPPSGSLPIILHRPFRSVAELGYVFKDTPWKNIDFFNPESGDGGFLDAFCINEDYRPDAVEAGRVDLNTQQAPVIQALLAGAYRDETAGTADTRLLASEAATISNNLVTWTSPTNSANTNASGKGPLANIADLVGRWKPGGSMNRPIIGSTSYAGFTSTLAGAYSGGSSPANNQAQRFVESSMRALSDAGQAGTWNLLIDVVAQSGRYPINTNATNMAGFLVEGERHYWVHVAIDRSTGQVIDENIEVVNE
jgi:hypothetical protein